MSSDSMNSPSIPGATLPIRPTPRIAVARAACALLIFVFLTLQSAESHAALMRPALDDLTYADLRTELAGRIPAHAPEWTNHNSSDPGFALLDLFGFLDDIELDILITDFHSRIWWANLPRDSEQFLGEFGYSLLEAGLVIVLPAGEDVPLDWPKVYSVNLNQTFDELVAAGRVPEPATLLLLGLGVAGFALRRFRTNTCVMRKSGQVQ